MQFELMSPSLEVMTIGLIRSQFITYAVTSVINDRNDLATCNFYDLRIIAYALFDV